ncbi:uncharacterized protein LOC131605633 [Vicia villosa]|uniref:uncharacterized protein LOC131605633 n=1 Tax=Vicia villosa TaxID=3911 RepID=UPI00273BDD7C|nr:uncharacterized protein LOC131605633 [Vicia villosa]
MENYLKLHLKNHLKHHLKNYLKHHIKDHFNNHMKHDVKNHLKHHKKYHLENQMKSDNYERRSLDERALARYESRRDVLESIISRSDSHCIWELRMCRNTFAHLCEVLRIRGGLVQLGQVSVEEQVAVFLNILPHHTKNRSIQVRLSRSGQTVSRYCHRVLVAVLKLRNDLLAKPEPVPLDCSDERWKWFKGCLGALDGTYIAVTPSVSDRPRYRTRKGGLRCFGLLKKRWAILRSPSFYPIRTQCRMILACCLLHNFIRVNMTMDPEEFSPFAEDEVPLGEEAINVVETIEPSNQWTQRRDVHAQEMFTEWRNRHRN